MKDLIEYLDTTAKGRSLSVNIKLRLADAFKTHPEKVSTGLVADILQLIDTHKPEALQGSKTKSKEEVKQKFATECTELNASGRLEVKGTPMEVFEWFWNNASQDGWVSVEDVRNKLTPFANLIKMMEDFNVSINEQISDIFFEELKQCKANLEYLSNPPTPKG